jgi:hypothetical protein
VFKKMAAPLKPTLSFRKSNTVAKRISKEKDDSKISHITRSVKEIFAVVLFGSLPVN